MKDTLHTVLVGIAILAGSFTLADTALHTRLFDGPALPPVTLHSVEFTESEAVPGDVVHLEIDRTRNRYCLGEVHQLWRREGIWVQAGVQPTLSDHVTGRVVDVFTKRVPATVTPGYWCYEPMLVYNCPESTQLVHQPPACIIVEEKE